MMKNFQLLENEHEHTGNGRNGNGPLAAFTEVFNGRDYFHLHRVTRDHTGMWAVGKQCITCPVADAPGLLAALHTYTHAHSGYFDRASTANAIRPTQPASDHNGAAQGDDGPHDDAMQQAAKLAAEQVLG